MPKTIVIDDDPETEAMFMAALAGTGAAADNEFVFAASEDEALALFQSRDDLDIAIVRIDSERLSGMKLFLQLDAKDARLPRIALASLVMGAGLWALAAWLLPWFDADQVWRVAGLALLVAGGLGLYTLLAVLSGALRLDEIKALRRRSDPPPS